LRGFPRDEKEIPTIKPIYETMAAPIGIVSPETISVPALYAEFPAAVRKSKERRWHRKYARRHRLAISDPTGSNYAGSWPKIERGRSDKPLTAAANNPGDRQRPITGGDSNVSPNR